MAAPRFIPLVKRAVSRAQDIRFHRRHHREAARILATIEGASGRLDPRFAALSAAYAQDVLGWRGYAPWLRVYSAVSGEFHEGWIPDNYYGAVVVPTLQGLPGEVSGIRMMAARFFGGDAFPDLVYHVNGLFITPANEIVPPDELSAIFFRDTDRVVFKGDDSARGQGVRVIEQGSLGPDAIRSLGNGVFQSYIRQHPALAELVPGPVTTLRMTTAVNDAGVASVRACYVRMGRTSETHVASPSLVRLSVDLETGAMVESGLLPSWLPTDRHPETQAIFGGRKVPDYDACVSTVLSLHRKIPGVRCIGWDLTVDRDSRVRVMEWNGRFNDIKFSEATQGPCFADLGWESLWRDAG